jgi:hypothetical protein
MISIKEVKQLRENFGFTHLVIFGISNDGKQHVATHGKTAVQAKEAAFMGNNLKKDLGWPSNLCNSKPLERICEYCSYWQRGYHSPGDVIQSNMHGKCLFSPEPIKRFEQDRACINFEPSV